MSYKPQEMENTGIGASIYALISLSVWFSSTFITVSMGTIQTVVSIMGGLIAAISGAISIYKNLNKPK